MSRWRSGSHEETGNEPMSHEQVSIPLMHAGVKEEDDYHLTRSRPSDEEWSRQPSWPRRAGEQSRLRFYRNPWFWLMVASAFLLIWIAKVGNTELFRREKQLQRLRNWFFPHGPALPPKKRSLVFIHSGAFAQVHAFAFLFARYSHPHTVITLLRHYDLPRTGVESHRVKPKDSDEADWQKLFDGLNMHVRWYDQLNESEYHSSLYQNYVHSSSNPLEYERFCIARFASLLTYMKRENVEYTYMIDLDVITFDNVFDFLPNLDAPWLLGAASTWFAFWDLRSVEAFVRYIDNFYNAGSDAQLLANFRELPRNLVPSRESVQHSDVLWRIWPPNELFYQVSDMYLLSAFVKAPATNAGLHPHYFDLDEDSLQALESVHILGGPLNMPDICDSVEDFYKGFQWNTERPDHPDLKDLAGNDLIGVHLQGPLCKGSISCELFCGKVHLEHKKWIPCCL